VRAHGEAAYRDARGVSWHDDHGLLGMLGRLRQREVTDANEEAAIARKKHDQNWHTGTGWRSFCNETGARCDAARARKRGGGGGGAAAAAAAG
jgi:hypothetical protein